MYFDAESRDMVWEQVGDYAVYMPNGLEDKTGQFTAEDFPVPQCTPKGEHSLQAVRDIAMPGLLKSFL